VILGPLTPALSPEGARGKEVRGVAWLLSLLARAQPTDLIFTW
jgi:hypothetical protein